MKKAMHPVICIFIALTLLVGCSSDKMLNVDSKMKIIEKNVNKLNVDFFLDNVYVEPIETESEALVAAELMGEIIFQSAGTVVDAWATFTGNAIAESGLATKKELKDLAKSWKDGILDSFEYKITDYEELKGAHTDKTDSVIVKVKHNIKTCILSYNGEVNFEFIKDKKKWKFRIIPDAMIQWDPVEVPDEGTSAKAETEAAGTETTGTDVSGTETDTTKTAATEAKIQGIDLNFNSDLIKFLLVPDNTKSMKGYASDSDYVQLMKGLANILNEYKNSMIATLSGNKDGFARWFPYNDNFALGITKTDSSYPYYCTGCVYEHKYEGPVALLLKDEEKVGAFADDTVTIMVTDLQEQGSELYTVGSSIRKKLEENYGNSDDFAIAILSFNFLYNGTSYIVDPDDLAQGIETKFDGTTDRKPVYVILSGDKNGVYDYLSTLKSWLKQNNIDYDLVDNLKVIEDPEVEMQVSEAEVADADTVKAMKKSKSSTKKEEIYEYVNSHITRLEECSSEEVAKFTSANVSATAMCYKQVSMQIDAAYKGFFNWAGTYQKETYSQYEEVPYVTELESASVYREEDGEWVELPEKEWTKLFEISDEDGLLRVSCIPKNSKENTFKKANFKVVFHMKQTIDKKVSYPKWIKEQDLTLSGVRALEDQKEWHKKTLDLDFFCRSMLSLTTTETTIDCGVSYTDDVEIVLLNTKNK